LGRCGVVRPFFLALLLAGTVAAEPIDVRVRSDAGPWETRAAADLSHYIGKMTRQSPRPVSAAAGPGIIVGELALQMRPELRQRLQRVAKPNPEVQADAIVLLKDKDQLFVAGSNDDSHYFAAAELLRRWGCRWYMPAPFGEHIPHVSALSLPALDFAYAPPFEIRQIWVSWNGSQEGWQEFARRNFLNQQSIPSGHILGEYIKEKPDFSLGSHESAAHVASKVAPLYAKGQSFSLSVDDALVPAGSAADKETSAGLRDKYFLTPVVTDNYLTFANNVAAQLQKLYPASKSRVGFLAYVNLTLPPQRVREVARQLVAYLAPIDFDPNHAFGDPRSPNKEDLLGAVTRWARIMQGRVVIYDYDQGMLLWRDIPNPSQHVIARDVQTYRKLGILGFGTESRNAGATTFLNQYFRGQLYWNPDLDVEAELQQFFTNFYGTNSAPMAAYWNTIFTAWKNTHVTEHEYFAIPAIYPRQLVTALAQHVRALNGDGPREKFTRLGFEVLDAYTQMVEAANTNCDYAAAVAAGERGLKARTALTELHDSLTTYVRMPESGPAYWPGEVEQYRKLAAYKLLQKTPLQWNFRADPEDRGIWQNWSESGSGAGWSSLRTDMYLQAQLPQTRPGYAWYACRLTVPPGKVRLMLPGLFNDSWLYVDGVLHAHREQHELWWRNPYDFSWDVEVPSGPHLFVLRTRVAEHLSGLFRRPFLYAP
jgi:hypothetical protein